MMRLGKINKHKKWVKNVSFHSPEDLHWIENPYRMVKNQDITKDDRNIDDSGIKKQRREERAV